MKNISDEINKYLEKYINISQCDSNLLVKTSLLVNKFINENYIMQEKITHRRCQEGFQQQIKNHFSQFQSNFDTPEIKNSELYQKICALSCEEKSKPNFDYFMSVCQELNVNFQLSEVDHYLLAILMCYTVLYSSSYFKTKNQEFLNISGCSEFSPFCQGETGFTPELVSKIISTFDKQIDNLNEDQQKSENNISELNKKIQLINEGYGTEDEVLQKIKFTFSDEALAHNLISIKSSLFNFDQALLDIDNLTVKIENDKLI